MNATNNMAACYLTQGQINQAEPFLNQSLHYAKAIEDTKGQANAYNNLAIVAEAKQTYDSAIYYLDGALIIYQGQNDSAGIARTFLNQAFLFDYQQKNDSAIFYCIKALRIQEGQGLTYQQANSHTQIGNLYFEQENYTKALEHFETALSLFEKIGDFNRMVLSHNNIGSSLDQMKQYDEASFHLEKAVELARKTEDPFVIGTSLTNLADFYSGQNIHQDKIEGLFQEAISLLKGSESNTLSVAYHGLGRLYFKREQLLIARSWFQKALETAIYFEDLGVQKSVLGDLADLYEMLGNPTLALQYHRQFKAINDSLINAQSLETINKLNIQFETEQKEKQNLQLQNDLQASQLSEAEQKALRNQILGISALLLLLGLGGFIYYRYRQRIRIKEREMALEQERLRKEQREKEAAKLREHDAMKTRFFTNISHEFRTPLTLIIGQNDQVKEKLDDQGLKNRLEMVGRNGHRLLDLVNQVLDVAKLEAGGMTLEKSRLDAIPFMKHMLYSFESMAQEKGIELEFDSTLEKVETAFDQKKIERVIFNLLSNAMKFTAKGGTILMGVYQEGDRMLITIADSGVGIKTSQLPYIFDRFYQADSSESQPQPGTGIGLSLVKELVELHGGNIDVNSELNQGTTFSISLPIPENLDDYVLSKVESQVSAEALPSKNISQDQESFSSATQKEQILLVEDNPDVRAFVREQILSFGYQVHEAADGVEGLEKAQEIIPDLIISDIMMPRLDGYGVAKGLKEDERTSHIPVILLTSKASDESKIAGLELGVDDYLLKPFNSKELEIRIANLIEQRKRLRERFSSATVIRPNEVSAVSMDQAFIKKVLDCIEENMSNEQFGVDVLAENIGMSVNHLNRKLGALVDQTAGKLIRSMRLQRAADLIKQKAATISEIAYDMGFNSHTAFARSFKKQFGVTPTEYMES